MTLRSDCHVSEELWEVNERLLIAGLRNHELADELHNQLSFIRAVTDSVDEGVCALDLDGRAVFANAAAADLLGTTTAGLDGQYFHGVVHNDCGIECPFSHALESNVEYASDRDVFMGLDRHSLPVSFVASPIAGDEHVVGTVVVFRDITDRLRLQEAQESILVNERGARANAEAAAQLRTDVIGTISHDLRTPLTLIKGYAQRLLSKSGDREMPNRVFLTEGLEQIEAAATKMAVILGDLLDTARLDAGKSVELTENEVDLIGLATDVVRQQAGFNDNSLVLEVPEAPLVGTWDYTRIERVLHNLISNAIKYSPDSSPINVRLWQIEEDGGWVAIEVRDQGIGIPAKDLPHIFTRYYRATNSAKSTVGIGLGLAGSKAIIERHGGTINLESIEGRGTTVTVWLPVSICVD